jgi:hypothetical protein
MFQYRPEGRRIYLHMHCTGSDCVLIGSCPSTIFLIMQGETGVVRATPVDHQALSLGPVGSSLLKYSWFNDWTPTWEHSGLNETVSTGIPNPHIKNLPLPKLILYQIQHQTLSTKSSHANTLATFIIDQTQKNLIETNRYLTTRRKALDKPTPVFANCSQSINHHATVSKYEPSLSTHFLQPHSLRCIYDHNNDHTTPPPRRTYSSRYLSHEYINAYLSSHRSQIELLKVIAPLTFEPH